MNILVPREKIVARARELLVGMPKRAVDSHSGPCGRVCLETHLLGTASTGRYSNDDALEGQDYDLLAEWDIHAKRYVGVYAYFPGILGDGESIDVSEVLK